MPRRPLRIRPTVAAEIPDLLDLNQRLIPGVAHLDDDVAKRAFVQSLTYPGSAMFLDLEAGVTVSPCTLVVVPDLALGVSPYG